ncbi:MAG: sigma-70 family RNA polymerase sigma factor [Chloroflexi bacterium]|nr:sigma-70 family RNA polymerase sigma factor [Chloroflexota bacterium]
MVNVKERRIPKEKALEASFEEIFHSHWPRVYGVLIRLLGDPDEAEDISLEAFLRLHNHLAQSVQMDHVGGWLYRVSSNLGLNALRSKKRRKLYEDQAAADLMAQESDRPDPLDEVEASETRKQVRKILTSMKPRSAQILVLRASGFTYQEIAETLRVSQASIGSLLSRAQADFEKRYRKADGG